MAFEKIILPNKKFPLDVAREMFEPCAPYFSKEEARPYQKEIIGILRHAIENDDKKYIFLQLPTGSGKSVIAITIAEYFKNVHNKDYYVLSMDHGLTSQYKRDYPFLKEVKGRQNFWCILSGHQHQKADEAPCASKIKQFKCPEKMDCPYFRQRDEAAESLSTLSTPYYIDITTPGQVFDTRFLSIRDEAHKLENFYLGMYELKLTERDYKYLFPMGMLPMFSDPDFWKEEIKEIQAKCDTMISQTIIEDDLTKLEKIESKLRSIASLLSMKNNVVIDVEESKRGYKDILFRPVKASSYANDIIGGVSEHTIFMSATILSVKDRCEQLGIPIEDVLYINFKDSFFPKENRHFIFSPQGSMSFKSREKTIPKIIEKSATIIKNHSEQRGVIICASHVIRDSLYKELSKMIDEPKNLITHGFGPGEFNEAFEKFLENRSKPYVFITTRYEGLDFYGKLAEWMIYTNLPYAPPMDKQVAARLKLEQTTYIDENGGSCGYEAKPDGMCVRGAWCHNCRRWYDLKVAEAFQQALGRVIRTPEDIGYLYVLDSRFEKFYNQNADLFLSFLRESIEEEWEKNGKKKK